MQVLSFRHPRVLRGSQRLLRQRLRLTERGKLIRALRFSRRKLV